MVTRRANAERLAAAAEAARQDAVVNRPDLVRHYADCRDGWRDLAKRFQTNNE